jgi:Icc-related predicted phosphoesterase
MRVLALADRPFHADAGSLARQHEVDAILTLGDLQPSWLETLDGAHVPKLGVYGNHDDEPYMTWFGIDNLHMNRIELDGGVSFAGFEGCVTYRRGRPGGPRVGPTYTQQQASRLVKRLPAADVLVAHCPPRGVNDDPDDVAHIGFDALRDYVWQHNPRWLFHGHTYPQPGKVVDHLGDTRVFYVSGARVVDLK